MSRWAVLPTLTFSCSLSTLPTVYLDDWFTQITNAMWIFTSSGIYPSRLSLSCNVIYLYRVGHVCLQNLCPYILSSAAALYSPSVWNSPFLFKPWLLLPQVTFRIFNMNRNTGNTEGKEKNKEKQKRSPLKGYCVIFFWGGGECKKVNIYYLDLKKGCYANSERVIWHISRKTSC